MSAPAPSAPTPPHPPGATRPLTCALVGNPNCGKTTLFNALTGLRQKVGNYPGVTVEKKVGIVHTRYGEPVTLIDLPGAYSLAARSPDEAVLRDVLLGRRTDTPAPDCVMCVVDASNLERNLYLVHQVLSLGRPTLVVLNMIDIAEEVGNRPDTDRLAEELGVRVIATDAAHGIGIPQLKLALARPDWPIAPAAPQPPAELAPAVTALAQSLVVADGVDPASAQAEASLLILDQNRVHLPGARPWSKATLDLLAQWQLRWAEAGIDAAGTLVAARYAKLADLVERVTGHERDRAASASDRIDAVVTHPFWGWAILGGMMALLFLSIFTLAELPMQAIDGGIAALANSAREHLPAGDLRDLLTDGVLAGVGAVVIFLPQILILFFFIGLLESTGYMARAAFIMDRMMSRVGLHGKAFIPLLSSYACAIPGIMATRTIEDSKDRLVTILVAPLMSCSARIPVYVLMIAALVPGDRVPVLTKVGLMMLLYALGTGGAFFFAWLFKRTLLRGDPPLMIMELPPYRLPSVRQVLQQMLERGMIFLRRAGTVILAISMVLWFLTAYPKADGEPNPTEQLAQSYAGQAGKAIEPALRPLGFDWQIGIGVLTSFAAREVFVSTMGVVFQSQTAADDDITPLRDSLRAATWPDGRPLFTPLTCFSLLVFYVFALQCASTIAVVRRETNSWRWPLFQFAYLTATAWFASFAVFQIGSALGF